MRASQQVVWYCMCDEKRGDVTRGHGHGEEEAGRLVNVLIH